MAASAEAAAAVATPRRTKRPAPAEENKEQKEGEVGRISFGETTPLAVAVVRAKLEHARNLIENALPRNGDGLFLIQVLYVHRLPEYIELLASLGLVNRGFGAVNLRTSHLYILAHTPGYFRTFKYGSLQSLSDPPHQCEPSLKELLTVPTETRTSQSLSHAVSTLNTMIDLGRADTARVLA